MTHIFYKTNTQRQLEHVTYMKIRLIVLFEIYVNYLKQVIKCEGV